MLEQRGFQTGQGAIRYFTNMQAGPDAPWLVLLGGLTADHRIFTPQIEYFAGKVNILTWDAPSHGLSRPFPLDWTIDDLAKYLECILEVENVKMPVLAGHSLGGHIAQVFIRLFPGTARGLIAIDSTPIDRDYYSGWQLWFLRHTLGMYKVIPWKLLQRWSCEANAETRTGRENMELMMSDYGRDEFCELTAHGFRVLADSVDKKHPSNIDCPAALLCGTGDKAGFTKRLNRKWTRRSGISLLFISHAGHNCMQDNPTSVNRAIGAFLSLVR